MFRPRNGFLLPALLTAALAAQAGAQQQAQCSVNEGSPSQVAKAYLAVTSAQNLQQTQKTAEAAKQLTAAVKGLTDQPDKISNVAGRNLVLGKALALWLNQEVGLTPTRGTVGFTASPETPIDLIAAVDSLFGLVEKAEPACATQTAAFRGTKAWINLVNASINHLNADRADSAAFYAKRSMQLYTGSPYGHMVLGNLAQKSNADEAIGHFRAAVAASSDTIFNDTKRSVLQQMGNLAADVADSASAAATKQKYAAVATEAFEQLIKEFPESQQGIQARSGLARVRLALGDTAGFKATYADQLANPSKYSYQDLLAPAVAAARAQQYADAAKLFDAVLSQNAYNRDALFNAALMHYSLNAYDKMLPYIGRLVQIDPSNGENWRMYAHAYNGLVKNLKPSSVRQTGAKGARPAAAPAVRSNPAVDAQVRQYNDSTVKYFEMAEKMPVRVEFTEWTNTAEKSTVAGTVHNKGTAAKAYTMTVEFLDKAGTVLDTQTVSVAEVAPNAKGRFSATTSKAGVVGFRYKPLT